MGVLNSFFARGMENSPIKKIARGFCPGGGWSGLELTDTLHFEKFDVPMMFLDCSVQKLSKKTFGGGGSARPCLNQTSN